MERDNKKKRDFQGGEISRQTAGHTCGRKASADDAETSFCVNAFQSFIVLGKNELRRTSFLHWVLHIAGCGLSQILLGQV